MRLHLGHHFYGAGNLGDDFMLAGFLAAFAPLAPGARCTACVPFPLGPLRARFPGIEWLPYDETRRAAQGSLRPSARHPREQAKKLFPSRDFH